MKIDDLLNAHPEIEDYLISLVPAFSKLKNPILRNTVGKIATIEQAAKVGEISLPFLINSLNEKLGLVPESVLSNSEKPEENIDLNAINIVKIIDADSIINQGGSPLGAVMGGLRKINEGEALCLKCSFHPAPLIDKAIEAGFKAVENRNEDFSYSIYFIA